MSTTTDAPMVDAHGNADFLCSRCKRSLTERDFFDLGMRMPDGGETRDEYFDAELLDEIVHESCVAAGQRAG
jgi:hypothetical protein